MNKPTMTISWRDNLGVICAEVDEYGISFLEGYAIFSNADDTQYKVPVGDLIHVAL